MPQSVLIVRLGALGDLVHALPAAAAMRAAWPEATIDWLVDARYAALLALVPAIDGRIVVGRPGGATVTGAIRALRRAKYDLAVDLQGLLKSALFARLSGARRTAGFAAPHLRERAAGLFYTTRVGADDSGHVVWKNLSVAAALGARAERVEFPIDVPASPAPDAARRLLGLAEGQPFAILNPAAGWPNKQWPAERYGAIAVHLARRHGLASLVLWGPRERALAEAVAAASSGAARVAPATDIGGVLALARNAAIFVAGDTGPMQLAAAVGAPIVGVFGPTSPVRNGPWSPADLCLSRFDECECHHKRSCRRATPCIEAISVEEVAGAVDRRLEGGRPRG
ncbi:MAG TPA: glycosyltransferase family 9 protein [Vicinamibacterales bacterium]|nr:glycosyltransferase family 9 protein [Vicinamibacterales bacterium]HPW21651.1 glycosyltransferase family 9 protein [Vicinamibacterales bacterium]